MVMEDGVYRNIYIFLNFNLPINQSKQSEQNFPLEINKQSYLFIISLCFSFCSDRLSQNVPSFYGLPSETKYARYDGLSLVNSKLLFILTTSTATEGMLIVFFVITVVPADMWVESRSRSDSPLGISFPTGGQFNCTRSDIHT